MMPLVKKESTTRVEGLSKREDKKRINIRWNSGLFFQIGLIVSMLLVFLIVESNIGFSNLAYIPSREDRIIEEPHINKYVLEKIKPLEVEKPKEMVKKQTSKTPILINKINAVDNTSKQIEKDPGNTEVNPDTTGETPSVEVTKNKVLEKKNIMGVENAPIFPGCESLTTNEQRRACLDDKINAFINRKFNADKFSDKYAGEKSKIYVQFTVDSNGDVVDIMARTAHEDLGIEAKRVIASLPKMTPGKHNNQLVEVLYTVPIILNIEQ